MRTNSLLKNTRTFLLGMLCFSYIAFPAGESLESIQLPAVQRRLELQGEFSVMMPTEIRIEDSVFSVSSSRRLLGMSGLKIGVGSALGNWGEVVFRSFMKTGYRFTEGLFLNGPYVGQTYHHWFPIEGTVTAEYRIPSFPYVQPIMTIGAGAEWLHQEGSYGSLPQNIWMPTYQLALGAKFLDYRTFGDWFGGFAFSMSFQGNLGGNYSVRGWSYNLSASLTL